MVFSDESIENRLRNEWPELWAPNLGATQANIILANTLKTGSEIGSYPIALAREAFGLSYKLLPWALWFRACVAGP